MPTYAFFFGVNIEKIKKVAGHSSLCLRHKKEWPTTFPSFAFAEAKKNA